MAQAPTLGKEIGFAGAAPTAEAAAPPSPSPSPLSTGYSTAPMPTDVSITHINDAHDNSNNAAQYQKMDQMRQRAEAESARIMKENHTDVNGNPVK